MYKQLTLSLKISLRPHRCLENIIGSSRAIAQGNNRLLHLTVIFKLTIWLKFSCSKSCRPLNYCFPFLIGTEEFPVRNRLLLGDAG